jgi:hypothetical protein
MALSNAAANPRRLEPITDSVAAVGRPPDREVVTMDTREVEYRTTIQDEHWRTEEFQWVRILAAGDPLRGMVLLYLQKACTAFHEFQPTLEAGVLRADSLRFLRGRLADRVGHVLTTMRNNELDTLDGAAELEKILRAVESADSLEELAELGDRLHNVSHVLLDALEAT